MTEPPLETLSLTQLSVTEIGQRLRDWDPGNSATLSIVEAQRQPGLAVGVTAAISVAIHGDVGDYAFMLNENAEFEVHGSVGRCVGHSMVSGYVLIHGGTGNLFGAYATGGVLAALGTSESRCGLGLAGADIIVRSDVGDEAGFGMTEGTLVLGKSAGEKLGMGMTGGTIYVRGAIKSLSTDVRENRMKDSDTMRLSLLLARAGIRAAAKEFRAYRPLKTGGLK